MGKYDAISQHLQARNRKRLVLKFGEIERIIGARLPASARKYQAWWRGGSATWIASGWRAVPNFPKHKVTFIRDKHAKRLQKKRLEGVVRQRGATRKNGMPNQTQQIRRRSSSWGRQGFKFIATIALKKESGRIWEDYPQVRYANRDSLPLHTYGVGPFCRFSIPVNLHGSGVYLLTVNDDVKYVGETENLSIRFNSGYGTISPRNPFKGGQSTNCRINNLILGATKSDTPVQLWFKATDSYKTLEQELIDSIRPPWNRK